MCQITDGAAAGARLRTCQITDPAHLNCGWCMPERYPQLMCDPALHAIRRDPGLTPNKQNSEPVRPAKAADKTPAQTQIATGLTKPQPEPAEREATREALKPTAGGPGIPGNTPPNRRPKRPQHDNHPGRYKLPAGWVRPAAGRRHSERRRSDTTSSQQIIDS